MFRRIHTRTESAMFSPRHTPSMIANNIPQSTVVPMATFQFGDRPVWVGWRGSENGQELSQYCRNSTSESRRSLWGMGQTVPRGWVVRLTRGAQRFLFTFNLIDSSQYSLLEWVSMSIENSLELIGDCLIRLGGISIGGVRTHVRLSWNRRRVL